MKPFELTLRLRNNVLKQFRLNLEMSAEQIAEAIGISVGLYYQCEGLKWCPMREVVGGDRQWKPTALRIAQFMGVQPEDIWPPEVLMVTNPVLVREMSASDIGPLLSSQQAGVSIGMLEAAPDEMIAHHELGERLDQCLDSLGPMAASIVRNRVIENMHFDDIAKKWGFTRSRAQQIYYQSIDQLEEKCSRDPELRDVLEGRKHR